MSRCLFQPDAERAAMIDRNVRSRLAGSLASVFDACHGHLSWSADDQVALLAALGRHRVCPAVFGQYTELVEALFAAEYGLAQRIMDQLLQADWRVSAASRVVTLDDRMLGPGIAALYARLVDDDADNPVAVGGVDAAELARGRALMSDATALLRAAAPELLDEIDRLVNETVLVQAGAPPGAQTTSFDGASTFYLWGAIVLNITHQQSPAQLAQALAHEAGHAYLLGSTLGEPLVENDPSERFESPLRADRRPMDGLVHASFVLARMLWCNDRLLGSGLLGPAERETVAAARARSHRGFLASQRVIETQARFTPTGEALWSAARAWVVAG